MKHSWTKWTHSPPPHEIKVVGSWDDPAEKEGAMQWTGTSCKRGGCCFWAENDALGGSMVPPIWWRPADQPTSPPSEQP